MVRAAARGKSRGRDAAAGSGMNLVDRDARGARRAFLRDAIAPGQARRIGGGSSRHDARDGAAGGGTRHKDSEIVDA